MLFSARNKIEDSMKREYIMPQLFLPCGVNIYGLNWNISGVNEYEKQTFDESSQGLISIILFWYF